jgi:tetratricopeptide (TPR) repeat protein
VSTSRFFGILLFSASLYAPASYAQLPYAQRPQNAEVSPLNEFSPARDPFGIKLHSEFVPSIPPAPDWPAAPEPKPVTGVVSLHDLQHPIAKKALQAAYEAQQFSKAHQTDKAIAKLEKAIRIDPQYRDGHCNLGVQYARVGRMQDARAEFQKALDIGPPAAVIYADLALAASVSGQLEDAERFAKKALELDPNNPGAQRVIQPNLH